MHQQPEKNNGNVRRYNNGDNNVICDVCARKRKRSECVLAFGTGDLAVVMSCIDGCADYRHPLNEPPPIIFDGRPVPDARPDQANIYQNVTFFPFAWGSFPPTGAWGSLNEGNTPFGTDPVWTWGNFTRN